MSSCRISTCQLETCRRSSAHGFCVPHAWGWYFSSEAHQENTAAARARFQERREVLGTLRREPAP